jgi:Uma2 family endonuclease
MAVVTQMMRAETLAQMPQSDAHVELVKGALLTMPPAGYEHGEIAGNVFAVLHRYVKEKKLGSVFAAETGFILFRNPDTVRAPDAAFVSSSRVAEQKDKEGFFNGPPDLAVEVVSPNDTDEDVQAKVLDYLGSGSKLVWVIRPRSRTVTTFRSLNEIRVLTEDDSLTGEDVLPGFSTPIKAIFRE